jgi:hypothetical protein
MQYMERLRYMKEIDYKRRLSGYTVTRLDVIFRYPDRVPLTHLVHRAKRVFGMWA